MKVKASKNIRQFDEWERLTDGFKEHKKGQTPSFIGKDVAFDHPNTPPSVKKYLRHVHICVPFDNHPSKWGEQEPIRRTNNLREPEKDFWLIYYHDELNDIYYLLTIIGPDAHNLETTMPFLKNAADAAEGILLGKKA